MKRIFKIALVLIVIILIEICINLGIVYLLSLGETVKVTKNLSKYDDVIGEKAKGNYENKWDMSEEIFPKSINDLEVKDFKMVYYNPWDAQYLSYLVVDYNEEEYNKELERLNKVGIDKYIGYYGVTGFTKYKLLAMEADSYNGFVYAITKDTRVIYVEIIFCNYFMDLDYKKHINEDYLTDGFDASIDNKYKQSMMEAK